MQAEPRALCAVHPDRAADAGTCSRCGSFLCAECRVPGSDPPLCVECEKRASSTPLVRQVPILGIATMVHGGLVLLAGLFMLVYGISLAVSFSSMPEPVPIDPDAPRPEMIEGIMTWTMLALGAAHTTVGGLQLFAGFRVRGFRGRIVAIVSFLLGVLTVFGCYCAPSSLGLLVWGLIVLLHGPVAARFAQVRRAPRAHTG